MKTLCEAYEDVLIKDLRDFLESVSEEIDLEKDVNLLTNRQIMNILNKVTPNCCSLTQEGKYWIYRRIDDVEYNGMRK